MEKLSQFMTHTNLLYLQKMAQSLKMTMFYDKSKEEKKRDFKKYAIPIICKCCESECCTVGNMLGY